MTNSMNVANALLEAEGVELLMTGGHLRRKSLSFYGALAEQSLQNGHFNLLFLGVDGIDLERGVSTHHEDEARLNRCMCQVAERIIVVTDSSKFGRCSCSLHKIIDTPHIHTLITDDALPADVLTGLRLPGSKYCWYRRIPTDRNWLALAPGPDRQGHTDTHTVTSGE